MVAQLIRSVEAEQFKSDVPSFGPGDTVRVKYPQLWTVTDGFDYNPQAINRINTTITLDQPMQIGFEWDSIDEALMLGDKTVIMTAHPGRIKQIIDVPFQRPRDVIALSGSAEFAALKVDIWRVLEDEVMRAREELNL